ARFHRSMGREVFFLTGTDEHGDKIAQASAAQGSEPRAYADRVSGLFRSTWDTCGISYDHFVRTTDDYHVKFVQQMLQKIHDAGDIYFGEYGGKYCYGCERFYADRELRNGKCPDHETEPAFISEKNYFFRMSGYQQQLLDHLAANPDMISPAGYRNEVMGLLREPLEDLCISRPKSRLTWGIELPFDSNYVTYVWFDALVNYVSALAHVKGEDWQRWWAEAHHYVAKDILKPHSVFWPTMLMAAGLPVYRALHVHGYWNMGESKMSKSLGNVIRPLEMRERFGMDAFRYFLLREMAFGNDAAFTEDAFITRFNADLSNGIGNLVSRVLAMQQKYFEGVVQDIGGAPPHDADAALEQAFVDVERRAIEAFENNQFHVALEEIWKGVAACDKYIVEMAPFKLWKDEAARPRVGAILHLLCDGLRHLARLIAPAMPETSVKICAMIDASPGRLADPAPPWRTTFREGHRVNAPEPLFPRVEISKP
ncbi:MAG: methionine--tRNA ligase, partial [Vicinamibacterales bacterium]